MNKTLLAIAVGASLCASSASAAPTVYGKFNLALDSQKDEINIDFRTPDTTWKLRDNNNSSRLGVKGKEELGIGDLSVVYQLEYGIDPDGSESNPFSKRNISVGLQGGFGTVKAGFFDTLVKDIGGKVDQFNDTVGDFGRLMRGETRTGNHIAYYSPKIGGGLQFAAATQLGEGRVAFDNSGDFEDGLVDSYWLSATYSSGMFYGGIAYGGNEPGGMTFDGPTAGKDILRAVGKVSGEAFEVGALYQMAEGIDQAGGIVSGGDAQEDSWVLNGAYKMGSWKLKAQLGETDGDASGVTRSMMGIGADYKLSKAATAQVYYVTFEDDGRVVNGVTDPATDTFGVAFIYSF